MYYSLLPSRHRGRHNIAKLYMALTIPKGAKVVVLSKGKDGKIKSEVKTREQLIKEIKKELKIE